MRAAVILIVLALLGTPRTLHGQELAGRYNLTGVHEAGGAILLRPNGTFEFGFVYGALDQAASGRWTREGEVVTLVSDAGPPPRMVLGAWETRMDYELGQQKPAPFLAVRVLSPEQEVVWRDMEVAAEYANGARRVVRTARNGKAGLPRVGAGVAVRRITITDPERHIPTATFPVAADARTVEVHVLPGNLIKPAFERLRLRVARSGKDAALRTEDAEPMTFVRGEP